MSVISVSLSETRDAVGGASYYDLSAIVDTGLGSATFQFCRNRAF